MQFNKAKWGRRIIRAFGVLNILYAAAGFYFLRSVPRVLGHLQNSPDEPYIREVYCTMILVGFFCILALAVGGMYLLCLKRRGLLISNIVFVTEIAWEIGTVVLSLELGMAGGRAGLLGMSIASCGGIGGMGTAPQTITGYPVWALVILNLIRRSFPDSPLPSRRAS